MVGRTIDFLPEVQGFESSQEKIVKIKKLRNDMSRKSQTVLYSSDIILILGLLVMKEKPIGRHVKFLTSLNAFNQ